MQNFKLLFSVTLIVVIIGCAHGRYYKALRKQAADCIAGESKQQIDGCNWCECIEKGVLICTRRFCGFKPRETLLSARPSRSIKLEDWTPKWKKFFEETASCKVGEQRKDPDDCNWCECVRPGSMICDTNKKCSKKTEVKTLSASPYDKHSKPLFIKTAEDVQRWKKFTEIADSCTEGDSAQAPDGCNTCHCLEPGVMVCTRVLCVKKTGMFAPNRLSKKEKRKKKHHHHNVQSLKKFAENAAECTVGDRMKDYDGCNWCECVETGVMLCSRVRCVPKPTKVPSRFSEPALLVTSSYSKPYHKNYSYLRDKTKDCTPDGKTFSTPCHLCKCIHHGAMKCVSVPGSTCDKNKKSKKNPISKVDLPADSDYFQYN